MIKRIRKINKRCTTVGALDNRVSSKAWRECNYVFGDKGNKMWEEGIATRGFTPSNYPESSKAYTVMDFCTWIDTDFEDDFTTVAVAYDYVKLFKSDE